MSPFEDDEVETWIAFLEAVGEIDARNAYSKRTRLSARMKRITLCAVNSPAPTITTS